MYSKLPSPKIYRLPNEFSGKTGHKSGKLFAQFYFATVCVPTYPCSCVCMFAHTSRSRVYEPLRNNELPPPLRFTTAMQFNPVGSTKRLCPIDRCQTRRRLWPGYQSPRRDLSGMANSLVCATDTRDLQLTCELFRGSNIEMHFSR